ncbi:MAG TPA: CoA pyrophosphatase [Candidatus Krumholzibacteria bacterium]|jgi:8-oxo-dGTP pyrophosphatase MutT (NUDIX family)
MDFETRISLIEQALAGPLPGIVAKNEFWPRAVPAAPTEGERFERAAVLILLYEREGRVAFPLMERTHFDGDAHSGQISLPGGRLEAGEGAIEAALREAEEELHIRSGDLRVLGQLSPHWIPVSSYLVHPVVAWAEREPEFRLDEREVAALIRCSVEELEDHASRGSFVLTRAGRETRVPCWKLDAGTLWGATAMILAELLALFAESRKATPGSWSEGPPSSRPAT